MLPPLIIAIFIICKMKSLLCMSFKWANLCTVRRIMSETYLMFITHELCVQFNSLSKALLLNCADNSFCSLLGNNKQELSKVETFYLYVVFSLDAWIMHIFLVSWLLQGLYHLKMCIEMNHVPCNDCSNEDFNNVIRFYSKYQEWLK